MTTEVSAECLLAEAIASVLIGKKSTKEEHVKDAEKIRDALSRTLRRIGTEEILVINLTNYVQKHVNWIFFFAITYRFVLATLATW